ncbi:MAG: flavin reductase family protein, partial [Clostridia bacterium]|nr:flavin reductase family protein [Clostridia bacterium]
MKTISPQQWNDNLFDRIGKDWMLITAGTAENCNTMTASYGGFGILFSKTVAHIYVRPQRHTYSFIENAE